MFIATDDSQIINLDHVVSIKHPLRGPGHTVAFADGRTANLRLMASDLDELCGTTVPAPPGFMVYEIHIPSGSETAEGLLCIDPRRSSPSASATRIAAPCRSPRAAPSARRTAGPSPCAAPRADG